MSIFFTLYHSYAIEKVMSFKPLHSLLSCVTKKYGIEKQAFAGGVCQYTRHIIETHYPQYKETWIPKKIEEKTLYIQTPDSVSASALYLKIHHILECVKERYVVIEHIQIIRSRKELESDV